MSPNEEESSAFEEIEEEEEEYVLPSKPKRKPTNITTVIALGLTIVVIALGLISRYTKWNILGLDLAKNTPYRAVFLTNGQVYFGKIKKENSKLVYLGEIYYLQIVPAPGLQTSQSGTANPEQQPQQAQQQPQVTLVKLGNELHGPQDEMRIERSQLLFVEDLKNDSRVVQAIEEYKKQQGK